MQQHDPGGAKPLLQIHTQALPGYTRSLQLMRPQQQPVTPPQHLHTAVDHFFSGRMESVRLMNVNAVHCWRFRSIKKTSDPHLPQVMQDPGKCSGFVHNRITRMSGDQFVGVHVIRDAEKRFATDPALRHMAVAAVRSGSPEKCAAVLDVVNALPLASDVKLVLSGLLFHGAVWEQHRSSGGRRRRRSDTMPSIAEVETVYKTLYPGAPKSFFQMSKDNLLEVKWSILQPLLPLVASDSTTSTKASDLQEYFDYLERYRVWALSHAGPTAEIETDSASGPGRTAAHAELPAPSASLPPVGLSRQNTLHTALVGLVLVGLVGAAVYRLWWLPRRRRAALQSFSTGHPTPVTQELPQKQVDAVSRSPRPMRVVRTRTRLARKYWTPSRKVSKLPRASAVRGAGARTAALKTRMLRHGRDASHRARTQLARLVLQASQGARTTAARLHLDVNLQHLNQQSAVQTAEALRALKPEAVSSGLLGVATSSIQRLAHWAHRTGRWLFGKVHSTLKTAWSSLTK